MIFLHQSGGPSQIDIFDYKPAREEPGQGDPRLGAEGPADRADHGAIVIAGGAVVFKFNQHGQSGAWVSELLPHTAKIVDDICFVKSMNTDAINHDPAITFIQTGASSRAGRAWARGSAMAWAARTRICRRSSC